MADKLFFGELDKQLKKEKKQNPKPMPKTKKQTIDLVAQVKGFNDKAR